MKVELARVNDAFHFEATGMSPVKVNIDASPDIGGVNAGARPMELLLMGLAGCSAIDVLLILKKQRQEVLDLKISVDGEREANAVPSPFVKINVHFMFKGQLDKEKVERAIELSMTKYCSASVMLEKSAAITHTYSIEK